MIYKGELQLHREQGCGSWMQFHDDRGLHGDKKQYWDWHWTINFERNTKLKNIMVTNAKGVEVYNGPWTGIRSMDCGCKEVDHHEVMIWLTHGRHTAIITTDEVLEGYTKWASEQADKILLEVLDE